MVEYFAVVGFVFRNLLHIGIIISIWRFKPCGHKTKYHVGLLASTIAGTQAFIVLTAFRDLHSKGFDMFNPAITGCVLFLYLVILALRGNVSLFALPLEFTFNLLRARYAKR